MNKARVGTRIKLARDVMSRVTNKPIRSGTCGTVVANRLPDAHGQPTPILVKLVGHSCYVSLTVNDIDFA